MATNITIKNTNQIHHIKLTQEQLENKGRGKTWNPKADRYLKVGESTDIWISDTQRFIVQEMPT